MTAKDTMATAYEARQLENARKEARKKQQAGETDAAFIERYINETSNREGFGVNIAIKPCKAFNSTLGYEEKEVPAGFLVSIAQKGLLGMKHLPSMVATTKFREAVEEYNRRDQHSPNWIFPQADGAKSTKYKPGEEPQKVSLDTSGIMVTSQGVWVSEDTLRALVSAPALWVPGRGSPPEPLEVIAWALSKEGQRHIAYDAAHR